MPDNDDDVFSDADDDDGGALADLVERLRAARGARAGDLGAQRAACEERGSARTLPPGWRASPFDLGRPGEQLRGPSAALKRAILYLHGGGYCIGSLASCRALAAQIGHAAQSEAFTLDYRLSPEHPFPAALDDALGAYRRLLDAGQDAGALALIGDGAGAGLAIALAGAVRAARLPPPRAIVALSPWLDLSMSGDTIASKADADPCVRVEDLHAWARFYLGAGDRRDPRASPLFTALAGMAPILIHVGSEEVLLSDAERFVASARAAGVDATVEIWPGLFSAWHEYFEELEEAREAISDIGAWLKRRWP